ncbi:MULTISPECIES: FtsH protease activity modulator HflK [unclassified Thiobacillus]|jgi:membrane protease subunit HflK|uniref:FtsH protease activity modulator HflK n=1 Tax=unclassified Thiobacillus TaxID=2646513 RepID=UPI000868DC68|nr:MULTISPECIES: FtsH protease activity modulator HflK [unclassified Thiobacillus]MBD3811759.1 FtsH protease activity modulator HflK [Betaproteobacteria bacterium]MBS0330956.1 FtsH protease activity modulator HflK [Pseudomonadota bacterium]MBC2731785.1 FtsH protease activity modulator HflK [Thiobacillus sp.]MBC2740523.1 FtsH protease activity modulator HflK [Thiobacillus sp.]MBC2758620.1 FtsH protease activity modulator HflK [Thiobacillus sp.]
MAWNDPQWGNNGNRNKNSGPPDLDELWRRLNQRLNGMFGNRNTEGGGGFSSGGAGGGNLLGLLLGALFLVWVASGFYIVDTGQRGVVLRFGKYIETTEPGPRWHLPWPIESREIVNIDQVRTVEIGYRNNVKSKVLRESLMLTDDENIIDLQFAVQYILKDPEEFLFVNRAPEDTVLQVAETAMREIVGKNKMDFVLYEGRAEIATRAKVLMQQILDRYKTGISISQVTLQNIQPPEQVQAAFDDAVKAGQDRERLKNEAEAYSNDVVPRASGLASRLKEEAAGYKQAVIANAEGEASRFSQIVTEYQKAPQVTRQRMYLDTMQTVMNNTSKVVVDQKGGNSLLYLPLDKLQQIANQPSSGASDALLQPPVAATPTPPAPVDLRSRDALRSRDREDRP